MDEETRTSSQKRNTTNRNSAQRDKLEGGAQEARGRLKESAGALAGSNRMRTEGESDQLAGAARRKKGTWKDRIKSWIDRR